MVALTHKNSAEWKLDQEYSTPGGTVRWASFGSGPALVLVHGSPLSSLTWRDVLPGLQATHTVYVWDLLGYGQSDQSEGQQVGFDAQARILVELVKHWGIDRPRLLGHDFGGAIALRAHLIEGLPISDLTLVNAVGGGRWGSVMFRMLRDNADLFAQLPDYAHRALIRSHLERGTHRGHRPGVLDELLAPWVGEQGQPALYRQFAQASEALTDQVQDRLGDVKVPATIVWGRQDKLLPEEFAQLLREGIPHADFHWVENAGHLVQIDAPAALAAIVNGRATD